MDEVPPEPLPNPCEQRFLTLLNICSEPDLENKKGRKDRPYLPICCSPT